MGSCSFVPFVTSSETAIFSNNSVKMGYFLAYLSSSSSHLFMQIFFFSRLISFLLQLWFLQQKTKYTKYMPKSMRGREEKNPSKLKASLHHSLLLLLSFFFFFPPTLFSSPCFRLRNELWALGWSTNSHFPMEANKSTGLQDAHTTYLFSAGPELETSFFLSFFFLLLHLLLLLSSSDFYKPILFAQKPYHFCYMKTPCSASYLGVDNFLYFFPSGWKTPHPKNQNQEFRMLLNFHLNMSIRDHWVEQDDSEFIHDFIAHCERNSSHTLWSMMTLSSVNWISSKHFDPWWHCPVWTEFHPNISTHDDIAQCELSFIQKLSSMMGWPGVNWVSSKHIWPMMGW